MEKKYFSFREDAFLKIDCKTVHIKIGTYVHD